MDWPFIVSCWVGDCSIIQTHHHLRSASDSGNIAALDVLNAAFDLVPPDKSVRDYPLRYNDMTDFGIHLTVAHLQGLPPAHLLRHL